MTKLNARLSLLIGALFWALTVPPAFGAMVAHWTADGDFTDASGNGHDGTASGDTTFAPGVFGQAFAFDGNSDFISVAHSPAFNFGTGDFSATLRVNFDTIVANGNGLLDKDTFAGGSTFNGWLFNSCDACGGIGIETRNTSTPVDTNSRHSTTSFQPDTWFNLTATRENNLLRLYVDGVLQDTTPEGNPTDISNSVDLTIGSLAASGTAAQFFSGRLDDIAIFDHALSQSEVTAVFNGGVSAVPLPAALPLFGFGLVCLVGLKRRTARGRH